MNYIKTLNGIFNYDDIESNIIDIEDIAHSLSMQCRYGGHCSEFYSVANHSLAMADHYINTYKLNPENITLNDIIIIKQMLVHDAGEAYLTDLMRPIKKQMPEYVEIEKRIDAHIFSYLGLGEKLDIVKDYDNSILADEMIALFGESYVDFEPLGIEIKPDPRTSEVKQTFIFAWNSLTAKEKELKNDK